MKENKKENTTVKINLHERNKHRTSYDFKLLTHTNPELGKFIQMNKLNQETIDFSNPKAVLELNRSLLKQYYNIDYWDIPSNFLCPPIPGRADYIHYLADLLAESNIGTIPTGSKITGLDIGVGSNCIYPIIGTSEYGWNFIGSEINIESLKAAKKTVELNNSLIGKVDIRHQINPRFIFENILRENEKIDFTICNPPFHSSLQEALSGTNRKLKNLNLNKTKYPALNFGGQSNELWCEGGELKFIRDMIFESRRFSESCLWFTTLVSKQSNLKSIYSTLKKVNAVKIKTVNMAQGNKISRFVAWSFLNEMEHKNWIKTNW